VEEARHDTRQSENRFAGDDQTGDGEKAAAVRIQGDVAWQVSSSGRIAFNAVLPGGYRDYE
jgi:hypothetical protein